MKKNLCRLSQFALFAVLFLVSFSSCTKSGDNTNEQTEIYTPLENDPVEFKNSVLLYHGVESSDMTSSWYKLSLYTDMVIDATGNPVGPGQLLRLSINATLFDDAEKEFALPVGRYNVDAGVEIKPFTFNHGFMNELNLPSGIVNVPDGSFFGDVPEGTAEYVPDMLDKGSFTVSKDADGIYTIEGMMIGEKKLKHKFIFKGELKTENRSDEKVEYSSLTKDMIVNDFAQIRLQDKGDSFWVGDNSYRTFEVILADKGINLMDGVFPTGTGRMLRMELFVAWGAESANGVPAGTYNMAPLINEGGMQRKDIIPFNIYPGIPSKFETPSGTWYLDHKDNKLVNFGMLQIGKMVVERDGDAHTFKIEFVDCNKATPHKVVCNYSQKEPIQVYKFTPKN